jgi:hypothetical protein
MIRKADGERLRQTMDSGVSVQVALDPALKGGMGRDILADTISDFSSRGPARNGEFKPNIAAPGTAISAPGMGTGDGVLTIGGTSMSSPMVAGAAAVMIQRLRDQGLAPVGAPLNDTTKYTAADVGSFLMAYAQPGVWRSDNTTQDLTPLARTGAGRVDLSRAARGTTFVRTGQQGSWNFGINLGIQVFDDTFTREEPISLRNMADRQRRYGVEVQFRDPTKANSGVTYSVLASGNPVQRFNIGPSSSVSLRLKVEAAADRLRRYPIYGGLSSMNGDQRMYEAEYDAYLVITEIDPANQPIPGGDVVRVPIYFLPRGASVIRAAPSPVRVDTVLGQGPLVLTNDGGQPGRAELFGLWAEDTVENEISPSMNIDQLGVRLGLDGDRQRIVEFVVHFSGTRVMPLDGQVNVYLNTDADADMDWQIYNTDLGLVTTGEFDGRQAVIALDRDARIAYLRYFAGVDLHNRSVTLPALVGPMGFTGNDLVRFQSVVINAANFDTVPADVVPDGGYDFTTQRFTTERLVFDEAGLAYQTDRLSVEVAAEGATVVNVGTRTTASADIIDRILAVFPQNLQRRDDTQILEIELGEVPTVAATPTPRITATPTATPTVTDTPIPTDTPGPSDTPEGPTATFTPRPEPGPVYLPVLKREEIVE